MSKPREQKIQQLRKQREHVAELIRRQVTFFNGWSVSQESEKEACDKAAFNVVRYLTRRQK